MAFVTVNGHCINCGTVISANPDKVPSIRVDGEREMLCRNCFDQWNEIHRISKGLDPIPLAPDAYKPLEVPLGW